ncbi:ATP-binding cassette domain-containing protein [Klebsiella pneumoniae subsp. pneumoniae]|nr:ATP-binding cassette domain-containing protein [Klebsiella pneumoniae subsp. pneumoniae]
MKFSACSGPNGAGRSTTFKMMCGLLACPPPAKRWCWEWISGRSGKARQHLGYMAQNFRCTATSASSKTCAFSPASMACAAGRKMKIARMSDAFGLKSIARHAAADELPLGYIKRLALACSLMHEPDTLFSMNPPPASIPYPPRVLATY